MKVRGVAVFIGLIALACSAWAGSGTPNVAAAPPLLTLDVTKLKLASANALVWDAGGVDPHEVSRQEPRIIVEAG